MSGKTAGGGGRSGPLAWRLAGIFGALFAISAFTSLYTRPAVAVISMLAATGGAWVVTGRLLVRWADPLMRANAALTAEAASHGSALATAADENEALVRELHHRVRNNLQVIASLVNMQQRSQVDPSAQAALADMRDRLAALALIHRTLYQGTDLRHVEVRDFLASLIEDQVTDVSGPDARMRVRLTADSLLIDSDRLASLALFAVEAISNVRKHTVATPPATLRVDFTVRGDEANLVITDEGGGDSTDLAYEGAGRVLMAGFARQLKGRMDLGVSAAGGVTVRLVFPINPPRVTA